MAAKKWNALYLLLIIKEQNINKKKKENKDSKAKWRSERQIRPMCRQLYYKYKYFVWILDVESYFTLTKSEINGNDHFYSSNIDSTPNNVKNRNKFEDKLLVYAIISPFGISKPYITPSEIVMEKRIRTIWKPTKY